MFTTIQPRSVTGTYARVPDSKLFRFIRNVFFVLVPIVTAAIVLLNWHNKHTLSFRSPVVFHFAVQSPVVVSERVTTLVTVSLPTAEAASPLTPIQQYICDTFGSDCRVALAVQHAENGTMQCDRFGINKNGTIDVGLFQINSVHLKKGYTLSDLADCRKNVDIAFELFKAQGWTPWVAYNNGSYKKFMY